jgi:secondary thiamine-phosphate synthase enzyme
MEQALHVLNIVTNGQGLTAVTEPVCRWVAEQRIATGLLTIWCRHTSASLLVQENADPDVRADLEAFFRRLVPEDAFYRHNDEGPDDMPAHIKAALTQTQLSIPVDRGRPVLVPPVIDSAVDFRIDGSAMTEMHRDRETDCREEVCGEAQR